MIKEINSKRPNQLVINLLTDALAQAKAGDIQNAVVFGSDGQGGLFNQLHIQSSIMPTLGELRCAERDLINLPCHIRKSIDWYCE